MRTTTPSIARRPRVGTARATAVALAAVVALTGCADGAPGASTAPGGAPSSEPSVGGDAALERFETQNGTAAFGVPSGWTITEESMVMPNHAGDDQWVNSVRLVDAAGATRLTYSDGFLDDAFADGEFELVDERPIAQSPPGEQLSAFAWWSAADIGWPQVHVGAQQDGSPPRPVFTAVEGRTGAFFAHLDVLEICTGVTDAAGAQACLASPEVAEAMAVLETLEVMDVPWDAMP